MVVKIHKKGSSFRGIANYLLHDVKASTSERVAWTANLGIASRNPHVAWRIMAATAMDQDRLKAQAGVANSGRKSKDCVSHISLSWHPEEAKKLTQLEMLRAAKTMLVVMGAPDHQAMVVAHRDSAAPHLHVVVNRVNPNNGRMLSSSFEKLKASQWAQKYEEERGKIYCEERVINNAARGRGEFTRGKKDRPRHVHEIEKSSLVEDKKKAILEEHRQRAAHLKAAERSQKARQAKAWSLLQQNHKQSLVTINAKAKRHVAIFKTRVQNGYRPRWEARHHEHRAALQVFQLREAKAAGRMKNALNAIDFAGLVGRRGRQNDGRAKTLSEAFQHFGNAGVRLQTLQRQQEIANARLLRQQKQAEAQAELKVRAAKEKSLKDARHAFMAERASLLLVHRMENARLKALWHTKQRRLREELRATTPAPKPALREYGLKASFAAAANPQSKERDRSDGGSNATPQPKSTRTSPADLLPRTNVEQVARQIDEYEAIVQGLRQRAPQKSIDRDEGRER